MPDTTAPKPSHIPLESPDAPWVEPGDRLVSSIGPSAAMSPEDVAKAEKIFQDN